MMHNRILGNRTLYHRMLALCGSLLLLLAAPLVCAQTWLFDVYLDKHKMGTHVFEYAENSLSSRADFNVKLLFFNAYEYHHEAKETWDGNCLKALVAHTEENKEITDVNARWEQDYLRVTKQDKVQKLSGCTMTFAYWNPEMLKQTRLLNPQNAEYLDVTIENKGTETYLLRNKKVESTKYKLTGRYQGKTKLNITLWYDENAAWIGLQSITPEGYTVTYKLR